MIVPDITRTDSLLPNQPTLLERPNYVLTRPLLDAGFAANRSIHTSGVLCESLTRRILALPGTLPPRSVGCKGQLQEVAGYPAALTGVRRRSPWPRCTAARRWRKGSSLNSLRRWQLLDGEASPRNTVTADPRGFAPLIPRD